MTIAKSLKVPASPSVAGTSDNLLVSGKKVTELSVTALAGSNMQLAVASVRTSVVG